MLEVLDVDEVNVGCMIGTCMFYYVFHFESRRAKRYGCSFDMALSPDIFNQVVRS